MSVTQAWLLIGLPALILGMTMFIGRSPLRTGLGYLILLAGFGGMAAFGRAGGALFGGLLALLFAAGRGGATEDDPQLATPGNDVRGWAGSDRDQDAATSPRG